jgi:hypothetical protein
VLNDSTDDEIAAVIARTGAADLAALLQSSRGPPKMTPRPTRPRRRHPPPSRSRARNCARPVGEARRRLLCSRRDRRRDPRVHGPGSGSWRSEVNEHGDACPACSGTGRNPRGGRCGKCGGSGRW